MLESRASLQEACARPGKGIWDYTYFTQDCTPCLLHAVCCVSQSVRYFAGKVFRCRVHERGFLDSRHFIPPFARGWQERGGHLYNKGLTDGTRPPSSLDARSPWPVRESPPSRAAYGSSYTLSCRSCAISCRHFNNCPRMSANLKRGYPTIEISLVMMYSTTRLVCS